MAKHYEKRLRRRKTGHFAGPRYARKSWSHGIDTVKTPTRIISEDTHDEIRYVSPGELIDLNKKILEEVKVSKHDRYLLFANWDEISEILQKVKRSEGDVYDKAVLLLTSLVDAHVFHSGNKRTAFAATGAFLKVNGKKVHPISDPRIMQGIREGFYTKEEIKEWLQNGRIREFKRFSS